MSGPQPVNSTSFTLKDECPSSENLYNSYSSVPNKSGKAFQRSDNYQLGVSVERSWGVRVSIWTSGTLEDLVPDNRCLCEGKMKMTMESNILINQVFTRKTVLAGDRE